MPANVRETKVLVLVAQGKSNRDMWVIADVEELRSRRCGEIASIRGVRPGAERPRSRVTYRSGGIDVTRQHDGSTVSGRPRSDAARSRRGGAHCP